VLQEILQRYVAIDRRDAIQPAFDVLLGVVDQVLPIDRAMVERAKQIVPPQKHGNYRSVALVATVNQNTVDGEPAPK